MRQRDDLASPAWLDGQTIAIVSTVLTVGLGIGAMVFSATSSIRGEVRALETEVEDTRESLTAEIKATRSELSDEIKAVRSELSDEIEAVRTELSDKIEAVRTELSDKIEASRLELSAKIKGLDARLRTVEQDVARIQARIAVRRPLTHGTSPLDREEHGAGT